MRRKDITAFILAGGKSSRIGTNKALLKINGLTVIELIKEKLETFFENINIISNSPEEFSFLKLKVYKDIYPGLGPLSGIHSALYNSNTEANFIISCDLPLVNKGFIKFLINYKSEKEIIVPSQEGKLQPLCGVYKRSCITAAEELLKLSIEKKNKSITGVFNLIKQKDAEVIEIANLDFYSQNILFNLNTPEDIIILKKLYKNTSLK